MITSNAQPIIVTSTTAERDSLAKVDGIQVLCKDTGLTHVCKDGVWVNLTGATGSAGSAGATGAKGDKGDKGDIGRTGPAGTTDYNALSNKPTLGTSAVKDIPSSGDATTGQVVYGTDSRLTNTRTPSSTLTHASTHVTGSTDIIADVVAAGNSGLMSGADKTKLNNIASGANVGVVPNGAISGATNTKITYDAKGLVTGGAAATTADIADSADKRYCTDAQKTVIGSTSGANSGDNAANSSTMYIGTTSHALNRGNASEALTGITSIDGSAATLTSARNIGGRSFNGSADIVSPTWKTGITTRDITTASGTINIAHGLGRVPSFVRVKANLYQALTPPVTTECEGCYDGTNHSGLCTMQSEGTTVISADAVYSSTAFELGFGSAYNINPYTGATRQTATITVDGTNIIFTWTKTGTVASATANIMWECT